MTTKKALKIKMITAKGCKACDEAKKLIDKAAIAEEIPYELVELDSHSKEAIHLAETYRLDVVPSFVINGHGFAGSKHSSARLREAVKWGRS